MSSYLELLNLTREPFSNSPDPDAYCRTPTHEDCLNRLEIAIRLRRGLNVVLGEVGTGKSTLCRCLLRTLNEREGIDVFLLLDAGFDDADEFVRHLCELFTGERPPEGATRRECVGSIQSRVFDRALERKRNLVLFVDEGQKLGPAALEVLRELLNFETNTEKLLQIVIFGQPELEQTIDGMPNFKDRINECLSLRPLSQSESISLVRHRLRLAGGQAAERLFSRGSLVALHKASRGKPRQLMRLGHQMLLSLLVGGKRTVTARMVRAQAARNGDGGGVRWGRLIAAVLAVGCLAGAAYWMPDAVKREGLSRAASAVAAVSGWFAGKEGAPAASGGPERIGRPAEGPAEKREGNPAEAVPPAASAPVEAAGEAPSAPTGSVVPETLGTFRLAPGTALADIVRALYGSGSALELVTAKNPAYRTDVGAGPQEVTLPAVLFTPPASMTRGMLLSLGTFATPEEAYAAWRGYGKRASSLALTPIWRPDEGLTFHILAPRSFTSERNAWGWLSRFSPPSDAAVRLLPPFDDSCLVFHHFTVK